MSGSDDIESELRGWQKELFDQAQAQVQAQASEPDPDPVPKTVPEPKPSSPSATEINTWYGILTFGAVFSILVILRPPFVLRSETTKPYEAPNLNWGAVFLISCLAAFGVCALIWSFDKSQ